VETLSLFVVISLIMNRDRLRLAQLLKAWAQEHDYNYILTDPDTTDQGVSNTGGYLSWLIKEGDTNINLVDLLDRLEVFIENIRKRKYLDGMYCRRCQSFYEFAESNQDDGTLLCYSCRQNPYG